MVGLSPTEADCSNTTSPLMIIVPPRAFCMSPIGFRCKNCDELNYAIDKSWRNASLFKPADGFKSVHGAFSASAETKLSRRTGLRSQMDMDI